MREIDAADMEVALGRPQQASQNHAELALAVALDAGQPDDLAGTAIFLASSASDFVTGTAIPVDGGYATQI
jgi:2-deoxy-D-gluconate 3-dehydrogenase